MVALPFGGTGAAVGFNRPARLLNYLSVALLDILSSSCFDDYSMLSARALQASADSSAKSLLDLLGWSWTVGEKDKAFCIHVRAL